jgi:hypothetical protein
MELGAPKDVHAERDISGTVLNFDLEDRLKSLWLPHRMPLIGCHSLSSVFDTFNCQHGCSYSRCSNSIT